MLVSEEDAFSLCSIGPADTAPEKARIEAMRPVLMDMWAYILKQRASHLESNPLLNDCTVMFGDYTDPIGHELCVFIPADETDRLTEIKATFIQECENQMDSQRLLMAAKVLFCQ